jgi:hypothetical protein
MRRSPAVCMSSSRFLIIILCLVIFSSLSFAASADPVALITQPVDESKIATLAGNTRPEANKKNDRGLVADSLAMEHMLLQLKRSPQQEQALQKYLDGLQDKSSPNFHRWLTAKQYGQRFGLATQDLNTITSWLESEGFKVNVVYTNGMLIDFSGTAGQVRTAFHTEIHNLNVNGVQHIANMSDPQIPAALKPAVAGVVSLHDFKPHTNYKPRANYTFSYQGYTYYAVVPADLATIYNLTPLFNAGISGQGQTIVVIEDTDVYTTADWTTFRSTFGLSSYTDGSFTQVHPAGSGNCTAPGTNSDDGEAILDAEYASAAAPSAIIELASCADTNTTFGGLIALQNLLSGSNPPAIVSMSYGECEAFNGASANLAYKTAYQQAVGEGVSVFVSSGDQGAASCSADSGEASDTYGIGVSGFASTPYNVAVGGTDFGDSYAGTNSTYWSSSNSSTYESALSYVPEIPWNDSCASVLGAEYDNYSQTYGLNGFCNSATGENYLSTVAGSGGPSGCATGSPAVSGVVGGTCAGYSKPSWQSLVGNPTDTVRDIPDVSLFAANGLWGHYYPFCWSDPSQSSNGSASCTGAPDNWSGGGGTSFATPIMAGIQALVNQKTGSSQGNPNPTYYSLAATQYGASGDTTCNSTLGNATASTCVFYDVTQGDMDVNCTGTNNCYLPSGTYGVLSTSNASYLPAYGTTTGWDFATGIGTINAYNLVNAYANSLLTPTTTAIQASPTTVYVSQSVTLTATVSPSSATGTVSFFNNGSTTALGTATLSAGTATLAVTTLPQGTDSISATYGGDAADGSSSTTTPATVTVMPLTFTFASTGASTHTVLSGQGSSTYTFVATPTSGGTFITPVTLSCGFAPTDPTLVASSCAFSPSNTIAAGASASTVTMTITTTGPNSGTGSALRHRADNRSPWLPLTLPVAGVVALGLTRGKVSRKVSKRSAIGLLCFSLALVAFMVACGGSSSSPVTVSVSPSSASLYPNDSADGWPSSTQAFTAKVSNTSNTSVTWSVSPSSAGTIDTSGNFTAATIASGLPTSATITATSQASASAAGSATVTLKQATVPGTYAVTVTATESGATSQTAGVSMVVQ